MDLDRYLTRHRTEWDRLRELTGRVNARPTSLTRDELDEFVALHHRVSAQLSYVRGFYGDPGLVAELNGLVAGSNAVLYRRTASTRSSIRRFFSLTFPGAVWHIRRAVFVAGLALFVPWAVVAVWLGTSDDALSLAVDEATRNALVERDFENYYSSAAAEEFAVRVLVNNIQVSFLAFAAGVLLGIGSVFILVYNGANLGVALGLFIVAEQQPKFWGLILPHGLLELSAVIIAGAAGMTLGWALVAPGERTRSEAFTDAARRSVVVILGLMLAFVTAGIIEAFVTPSSLPTAARVGVGAAVEVAFVAYVVSFGRRAEQAGLTGLAGEDLEGDTARAVLSV